VFGLRSKVNNGAGLLFPGELRVCQTIPTRQAALDDAAEQHAAFE